MVGAEGTKIFDFDNARLLERLFREKNYIESYFYLLKSTKSTKTASQKYWRNIVWVDFFGRPYHANGIKKHVWVRRYSYIQETLVKYVSGTIVCG